MSGDGTIFALSSGRPPAAVAVVRVSGPRALEAVAALAGGLPEPRRASLRTLRGGDGTVLDRALVLAFPGPRTATGEDLAELHLHGGRATVTAVERALAAMPGVRPAEGGAFTRRALASGRLDLAQAEGLADLLEAETEDARRAALKAAEGAVGRLVGEWTGQLVAASALVEAGLDFADEGDVDVGEGTAHRAVEQVRRAMAAALAVPPVERLRDGARVVLAGPPNTGKSTLLNLLCGREAAIASPMPGTTRDVVEVPVRRNGAAYLLQDTAGLRDGGDAVEAVGIARARTAAAAADLVLWMGDEAPPMPDAAWLHARADEERERPAATVLAVRRDDPASVEAVWRLIEERTALAPATTDAVLLGERQRRLVTEALDELTPPDPDPLLLAEQLRRARTALLRITGADATEAMLDALFGRFCVGK